MKIIGKTFTLSTEWLTECSRTNAKVEKYFYLEKIEACMDSLLGTEFIAFTGKKFEIIFI